MMVKRKSSWRRIGRVALSLSGLILLGQSGFLGWSYYRMTSLRVELSETALRCETTRDWILNLEEDLLGNGQSCEDEFDRLVPLELDVTTATQLLLKAMASLPLEGFQYHLGEPQPWDGPVVVGHQVIRDRFELTFRCSFDVLTAVSRRLLSFDRLAGVRQVSVSRVSDGLLEVSLSFETYRRVPFTGGFS